MPGYDLIADCVWYEITCLGAARVSEDVPMFYLQLFKVKPSGDNVSIWKGALDMEGIKEFTDNYTGYHTIAAQLKQL